mgnify:CR=1 FL=1|jgi:hypothetical protein
MEELKDSVANVTTITGTGMVMFDWNTTLTLCLLISGIILNVQRIYHNRRKNKED